jgi:hypothetical protein
MEHTTATPTRAYDLLEPFERQAVDDYVKYAVDQQSHKRQRIALALSQPIPSEIVRRSKGALTKPLVRAAVAEKLQAAADKEDLSPDRVIAEHAQIAFSNIGDYLYQLPLGDLAVKPLDTIPREALAAVKSMKTIPSLYGVRTEITLHDKHPSLKIMAELMGLVAPDTPPVLRDYVRPVKTEAERSAVPEDAYAALLAPQ